MNLLSRISLFLFALFLVTATLNAQNFEDYVSKYTSENGKKYLQPLGDAFGANMNSGFFSSAHIPKTGLRIKVGLVAMGAVIADDSRTFEAQTEDFFDPPTTVEAPTIFGDTQGPSVEGTAGTAYNFPGGIDISFLPIAVPQLTIGAIYGTDVTLRYFDMEIDDNFGRLSLTGFGLRHNISQYFPLLPLDVAAGFYTQSLEVGSIVEATATFYSLQASKKYGLLTLYGGLGMESSTLDISYEFDSNDATEKISFDLDGNNSMRFTAGLAVNLGPIHIHSDYNFASQNVVTLGLNVGI